MELWNVASLLFPWKLLFPPLNSVIPYSSSLLSSFTVQTPNQTHTIVAIEADRAQFPSLSRRRIMVKTRSPAKVTPGWVFVFCVSSFFLGVIFTNRLRPPPDSNGALVTIHRHNQELGIVSEDCLSKKKPGYEEGVMDEVHRTHKVIKSLDKSVTMLEMELSASRSSLESWSSLEGPPESPVPSSDEQPRKRMLMVVGINTAFSSRKRRDSVRETWMPQGERLLKLEKEKGIVVRFMIGHTAKQNSVLDQAIASEEAHHHDFLLLEHVEGYHELSAKTKIFFSTALAKWDADFYVKVDDDVHVNLGQLAAKLEHYRTKSRVYIGCMKSGPVLSQKSVKYHEPEFWKFGEEGNKYFRHATGQIYAISRDLATFISINQPILHKYANEDVSLGAWFIGLDVEHVDDHSMCCGTPPDCESKTQAGNLCVASFDWHCSGICKSVERLKYVHEKCGERDLVWGDL